MEPVLISYLGIPVLPVYCPALQAGKKFIQLPIHGYTGGSQSESDIAIESSSSSKVSDTESDTTINGPLVDLAGFNKSSLKRFAQFSAITNQHTVR